MPKNRLQELYERKLAPSETASKELPLDRILKRDVLFYPEKPTKVDYDFVEIGPGTGDFLFHMAEENPDKSVLAIEIGKKRFDRIIERIEKRGLKNITLICGDARIPFHNHIEDNSLEKCFVLFPDPWPKNKHRHMRLLQKDFLQVLTGKLKVQGEFTLATDVKDYADSVLGHLKGFSQMKNDLGDVEMASNLPEIIPTFFKKKWEGLNRSFHYLRFRKVV